MPFDDATAKRLVGQFKAGDRGAFDLLFKHHAKLVRALVARVLKTRDESAVEDVCQNVWIKVLDNLGNYESGEAAQFSTWLGMIAKNEALNHRALVRRRRAFQPDPPELPSPELLSPLDREAFMADLTAALRGLPPGCADVFELRHLQGLSYPEIEQMTKVPSLTLYDRMARACAILREKLARWAPDGLNEKETNT
jgi:RNA polymerase sigma factor (sigma-70 family)